jgi:hypothetical protein
MRWHLKTLHLWSTSTTLNRKKHDDNYQDGEKYDVAQCIGCHQYKYSR